ncbi:ABC transporter permease subunit [Candidatus Poribacteria bacterium]|nr:ABC transporter permease subunit [Candidatus Poribacteria bacterium]MYB01379.1 ABC transporter permease subunit [Candidatus Poribacteria bacterium]
MNQSRKDQRVETKIFRGTGYLLLVAAAFCTMIPLLWLLTSSFKTANEIFAVPIQWFPSFPPRVTSSPYIIEDAYPKIEKPMTVDKTKWDELQPELTQAIWTKAQGHIAANTQFSNYVPSEQLQTEIIEGLWQQLVTTLPDEIWHETTESVATAVQDAVIPEIVDTIWGSVYREVGIGTLQIEDIDFNRTPIETVKWETASETSTRIHPSEDTQTVASLSYNFQNSDTLHITAAVPSPVPIERIRRLTLPVRGDASYHRLFLTVSVLQSGEATDNTNRITYQSTRPFVLESALWQDAVWRLHGIPGELESAHITMQQVKTDDAVQPPVEIGTEPQLSLQLTIHQPSYVSIVWDKLTSNYRNLWKTVPYNRYFINSIFIATASTLLTLFFCSLGGYAFAKYQFRGQKILFGILLASMMVPFQVLLVPLFGLMYDIGWLNSYKAIIIPFSVGAFGVFLMRQFIVTIPSELLDAARIDGCSEFGIYYRVVLPIIKPALGALTIYSFLGSWNGYLWPLIILRDEAKYTLPIGLANLVGIYRQDYGMLMAGTLLSLMPIVILFLAMQREFVQGITLGGVKE